MHNEYHLNDHFHWFGYLYGENELSKNLQARFMSINVVLLPKYNIGTSG